MRTNKNKNNKWQGNKKFTCTVCDISLTTKQIKTEYTTFKKEQQITINAILNIALGH